MGDRYADGKINKVCQHIDFYIAGAPENTVCNSLKSQKREENSNESEIGSSCFSNSLKSQKREENSNESEIGSSCFKGNRRLNRVYKGGYNRTVQKLGGKCKENSECNNNSVSCLISFFYTTGD